MYLLSTSDAVLTILAHDINNRSSNPRYQDLETVPKQFCFDFWSLVASVSREKPFIRILLPTPLIMSTGSFQSVLAAGTVPLYRVQLCPAVGGQLLKWPLAPQAPAVEAA